MAVSWRSGLWKKYRLLVLYGASCALLLFVLKWLQWHFLILDHSTDIYIGLIALIFTGLGMWLAGHLTKPKVRPVIVERMIYVHTEGAFERDDAEVSRRGLSRRELEVLELMSQGLSNTEIALRLYVSLSTVKTHIANLFRKLEVQRRTQAIETARRLRIIP